MVLNKPYVIDGDTIHGINDNGEKIKVRLTGIDAPEIKQDMGGLSSASLKDCVNYNSSVKLTMKNDNQKDRYGRYLANVSAGNVDCNLRQIEQGMAWFYSQYAHELPDGEAAKYSQSEQIAKQNLIGIWATDMKPAWEFRKAGK